MSKNSPAKYYQNKKERLQKAREKHQSSSKREKEENRQYGREQYKNLPEGDNKNCLSIEKKIAK